MKKARIIYKIKKLNRAKLRVVPPNQLIEIVIGKNYIKKSHTMQTKTVFSRQLSFLLTIFVTGRCRFAGSDDVRCAVADLCFMRYEIEKFLRKSCGEIFSENL